MSFCSFSSDYIIIIMNRYKYSFVVSSSDKTGHQIPESFLFVLFIHWEPGHYHHHLLICFPSPSPAPRLGPVLCPALCSRSPAGALTVSRSISRTFIPGPLFSIIFDTYCFTARVTFILTNYNRTDRRETDKGVFNPLQISPTLDWFRVSACFGQNQLWFGSKQPKHCSSTRHTFSSGSVTSWRSRTKQRLFFLSFCIYLCIYLI